MATEKAVEDACNMVWIAGVIRILKIDGKRGFCYVDVGGDSKYIPCTTFDDDELTKTLARFEKDDYVKIQGYFRAWSMKKDDAWVNNYEVRITHIKNEPPKRENRAKGTRFDDGVPF